MSDPFQIPTFGSNIKKGLPAKGKPVTQRVIPTFFDNQNKVEDDFFGSIEKNEGVRQSPGGLTQPKNLFIKKPAGSQETETQPKVKQSRYSFMLYLHVDYNINAISEAYPEKSGRNAFSFPINNIA